MVNAWVAGAERINGAKDGATYREPGVPWRVVWHTMEAPEDDPNTPGDEGWSLSQARSYIAGHQWPPHLWALYLHDHVFQTVALNLAAYALVHDWSGYPETNHAHAIQIEVMGYANQGLDDPGLCDWLGRRVLKPIMDAGVPVDLSNLARSTGSDGYGPSGAVRMSSSAWYAFDGLCGHANVPKNSHWDPGVADYARIARAAGSTPPPKPTPPPEEEEDMKDLLVSAEDRSPAWVRGDKVIQLVHASSRDNLASQGDIPKVTITTVDYDKMTHVLGAPELIDHVEEPNP
jgi:hypothetical protein